MKKNVYLHALGCDKNTVDSEYILGDLLRCGFEITEDPDEADLIVVNTCCFIEAAKEESVNAILSFLPYKEENGAKLIVSGCMAERYKKELEEAIPEIDGFIGVKDTPRILSLFDAPIALPERYLGPEKHTAYLKISDGCDRNCTYCAIPGIRGRHKSRSPEAIFDEARRLEQAGVKELIVIAQDLTQYGSDLTDGMSLSTLLKHLAEEFDFKWIRLLYLYPEGIDDALLTLIESHDNILPYFDMPVQHTNDRILKLMGRRITRQEIFDLVKTIRTRLPDAVLRTSLITGFPTETPAEHQALLEDVQALYFDRLGAFAYSCEENTPAARLDGQIEETVKEERLGDIEKLQNAVMTEQNARFVGKILPVLIEEQEDERTWSGRFYADAPDIDCLIYVDSAEPLKPGDMVDTRIIRALGYDFIGEKV